MKIKKLTAKNFRLFTDLEINFPDENFICLIGNNGSGKSAVLDAVNMLMSNFIVRNFRNELYRFTKDSELFDYELKWKNESDIQLFKDYYATHIEFYYFDKLNHFTAECNLKAPINFRSKTNYYLSIKSSAPIWLYFDVRRLQNKLTNRYEGVSYNDAPINTYDHLFTLEKVNNTLAPIKFEVWYISFVNWENEKKVKSGNLDLELEDLKPTRNAVLKFFKNLHFENYKNLSVVTEELKSEISLTKLISYVTLTKENEAAEDYELRLSQLSSGEKMVTFMVAEIARKLTIANENKAEALNGKGVVLIDELDLHLHPNWQRNIVGALKATFPNVQFITTTHSPQVLSSLKAPEIIEIDGDKVYSPSVNPYGRDSNNILSTVMNDGARAKKVDELINSIFINFAEDKNETAIQQIKELKKMVANDDPIFGRFESIIKRKEILNS